MARERFFASMPAEGINPSAVDAVYLLLISGNYIRRRWSVFVNRSWASLAGTGSASNTRASKFGGKYFLDRWSIQLAYEDGHVDRLIFCAADNSLGFILIGDRLYLKAKTKAADLVLGANPRSHSLIELTRNVIIRTG